MLLSLWPLPPPHTQCDITGIVECEYGSLLSFAKYGNLVIQRYGMDLVLRAAWVVNVKSTRMLSRLGFRIKLQSPADITFWLEPCFIVAHTFQNLYFLPLPKWAEARKISKTDLISQLSSVIMILQKHWSDSPFCEYYPCVCVFVYFVGSMNGASLSEETPWGGPGGRAPLLGTLKDMLKSLKVRHPCCVRTIIQSI